MRPNHRREAAGFPLAIAVVPSLPPTHCALCLNMQLRTFAHLSPGHDGTVALELPDLHASSVLSFTLAELQPLRASFHGIPLYATSSSSWNTAQEEAAVKAVRMLCAQKLEEGDHCFSALVVFLFLYLALLSTAAARAGDGDGHRHVDDLIASESVSVCIRSTVPVGAGLGSSAAFSVSCAGVLLQHFHGTYGTDGLPSEDCEATSKANINNWALKAETIVHGTPSGIDNSIATFGAFGALLFGAVRCCLIEPRFSPPATFPHRWCADVPPEAESGRWERGGCHAALGQVHLLCPAPSQYLSDCPHQTKFSSSPAGDHQYLCPT